MSETTAPSGSFVTKDGGARTEFGTGSVRDTEADKLDWTLLPRRGLARLVGLLMRGASKYGRHNWRLGQSLSRAERSLERHWTAYLAGERDEDHLAAVVFNACLILDHEDRLATGELPSHLDDRDAHRKTAALLTLTPLQRAADAARLRCTGCADYRPNAVCCGDWCAF